ncbi:hypothetical protein [Hyphomonas sp.]|uniref:hypothetical protein n=1 Tax=Hyphomonas sp. TaxID=87 RepID=UPI003562F694
MKKTALLSASVLLLAACANHQPSKDLAMATPGFMSERQTIEKQRPNLPATDYVRWYPGDRLRQSMVLDYVSGMSQRDYLFEEPNRRLFDPMLKYALRSSDLWAPTPIAARYALQIEFTELDSDAFGRDFAGKTKARYRVVDRRTGETVYEKLIGSNFLAEYPGLNEDDASFAYDVSAPGVIAGVAGMSAYAIGEAGIVEALSNNSKLRDFFGIDSVTEASQAEWNEVYQGFAWYTGVSAVSGPLLVALGQFNPLNYVSLQLDNRQDSVSAAQARQGQFSTSGLASRNAAKRARQLNSQLLAQSLSMFLVDLAQAEGVSLTQLRPCRDSDDASEIIEGIRTGSRVVTDNCLKYVTPNNRPGVAITSLR